MSVDFLFKLKRRYLFLFFALLAISILCLFCRYFVTKKVNENQEKLILNVKEEIGFPISFDRIKTSWFGFFLRISLENVTIYDSLAPIAFIKIDNIRLYPELRSLLFKRELQFNKVVVDGIKVTAEWRKETGFSLLGLNGESIATTIDYSTLMNLLSKHKLIMVKNGEISWQILGTPMKQLWNGTFQWMNTKPQQWLLTGGQEFFIKERSILPHTHYTLRGTTELDTLDWMLKEARFYAQCHFNAKENQIWQAVCEGNIKNLAMEDFAPFYPSQAIEEPWLKWLSYALPRGNIIQASFKVEGPVTHLQAQGEIAFNEVLFRYNPDWPAITEAEGFIKFKPEQITVNLGQGKVMNSVIKKAFATITPLSTFKNAIVSIEGNVAGRLEAGLLFLQRTPLQKKFASYLEPLEPRGFMDLDLKLTIPLEEKLPIEVAGKLGVQAAEVSIPATGFLLTALGGTLHFTEKNIKSSDLSATLDNIPIKITVQTPVVAKQPLLKVTASGSLSAPFLQKTFKFPILQKLQGQSLFTLTFKKPFSEHASSTEWGIASTLQGMSISLPGFLGKPAESTQATTLTATTDKQNTKRIALHIENLLDAKMLFQLQEKELQLTQGHIVLGSGNADWIEKKTLFINGEVENFKVAEWVDALEGVNFGHTWVAPNPEIHVLMDKLDIYGIQFDKVWLTSDFIASPGKWLVEGNLIKGEIAFNHLQDNSINIDLEYLKILKRNFLTPIKTNFLINHPKYALLFRCGNFQYEDAYFGEVSFKLHPSFYGYEIQDLLFETKNSELSGKGEWHLEYNNIYTVLYGEMTGINLGKTFSEWGYPSAILESSGYIKYQFKWPQHPFDFSMNSVQGTAEVKFDKGRMVGVNPGLGRIIGLLNVESIRRRLQLDFSDVLKKGFVFDSLNGEFDFSEGMASTKKLIIDSPSAKIKLNGNFDLKDKTVHLNMKVAPHMNVGIPIAAAIAAGPAVGAGVWILDKLTGSRINKITEHVYQVTGTWDAPNIQDLNETTRQ